MSAIDLTVPKDVIDYMLASASEEDWDRRADEVKEANGGSYPQIWFPLVAIAARGKASKNWNAGS